MNDYFIIKFKLSEAFISDGSSIGIEILKENDEVFKSTYVHYSMCDAIYRTTCILFLQYIIYI